MVTRFEIHPERLSLKCDADSLDFETTDEVTPLEGMIGQERALSALQLALGMAEPGFNLFVSGPSGTGKSTVLAAHIKQAAKQQPIPHDWGYVYNFQDHSQPQPISLPCGSMRVLATDMDELVDTVRRDVPTVFESDDYTERVEAVMQGLQSKRQELTEALEKAAADIGFTVRFTPAGITTLPIKNGQPLSEQVYATLPASERESIQERAAQLQLIINRTMVDIRRLGKMAQEETRRVDREIVLFTLTPIINELQEKYSDYPEVTSYLDQVETDMMNNLDMFKPRDPAPGRINLPTEDEDMFLRYRVNNLVDNTACDTAPVVFEQNPTYYNLFGRIDYRARMGMLTTEHTMIKGGAIHDANGGFLVLQAHELLTNPFSWQTLKRTLRTGELRIENMGAQYSPLPTSTLRPKPVPINTKIVMIGTPEILHLLQMLDADFSRYFKVVAFFDTVMERTSKNLAKYAAFVAARCRDKNLMSFHKTAFARVVDYSSRLAAHQEKLTTRFTEVVDILIEANHWAHSAQSSLVMGEHVDKTIEQRKYRASLTEDRYRELIQDDTIHILTDGKEIGQVNGLAVLSFGKASFGRPSRITARVSLGRGQLVNVERETKLSGRIHDKGFMVLTGYLRGKYGYDKPLSLNASIGFEQNYSEVDGDSASSTELYALLSAISRIPIAQGIAVTGSVDQNGNVQAIGGATQKIEGFFEVCKAKGLTNHQGVIIPRDNLKHLMLNDEVVEAVSSGRFHIYGISTIDEGIEVLTGITAGEPEKDGAYPEGTVHCLVEQRLWKMAQAARKFTPGSVQESDQQPILHANQG